MNYVEITLPKEAQKYVRLQRNDEQEGFLYLAEIEGIEKYLKNLNPKVVLDVGSGIGQASVFFFKYFNWTDSLFVLADGDSGEKQLSGMRTGKADFYNSLRVTESFCKENGISNFRTFNLEKFGWKELGCKPDLVYSFLALGFHWSINPFLEEIHSLLNDKCLLIFELRGRIIAKDWINQQIKGIDCKKYQIKELFYEPEKKKGNFIVLEKK